MSESEPSGRTGESWKDLAKALRAFKAGPLSDHPSDRALARAAGVAPTTIGDWLRGTRFPQDIDKVLVVVRMVRKEAVDRRITPPGDGPAGLLDEARWEVVLREEVRRRAGVVSDGGKHAQAVWALAGPRVRVREADPHLLGVHEAISVPGVPGQVPPEYVARDVDASEFGVRAKVAAAAKRGGFVLLVGGSSVGKTRCAVQAVKTLLPDWWLVHPAGPAEVTSLAQAPPPQTVVWLDELQDYLDGEQGLTAAVVRALLNASGPVVIVGTLWSARRKAYTAVPEPGAADPHRRERQVLDLASVIHIAPAFSEAEQDRARAAATRDPRLRVALESAGYGLTQTLAAAPQLVARWEGAKTDDPYALAVLTAALDVARLGARGPLSADLLRAAAPGYCSGRQQAEAPGNWFEQALAYATEKLYGAAAALAPTGTGMGQVTGYIVADYLVQHTTRERRTVRVSASTWDAIVSHIRDPADAARLGDSARNRLLYRYAISLYHHAADAGDGYAAGQLARLLADRGDLDGAAEVLRARADTGDGYAAVDLARLLADRGDLDGAAEVLRAWADAGDEDAANQLAALLAERGDLDELHARADAGDRDAAYRLVELLAERGDVDELRTRADAGDGHAAEALVELLAERGDLGRAEQILRGMLADAGDENAAALLDYVLAERGDLKGLRARADAGNVVAAEALADMLAERGDVDELRTRADAGDRDAAYRLVELLAERGDPDGAEQILRGMLADAGDWLAPGRLARLLAERGDLDELRALADAGNVYAAEALAERGDSDGAEQILRAQVDDGNEYAASRLLDLLIKQGRGKEAQCLRLFGLNPDGSIASV
jgi:thioredoxin-like negative regulator of GroEL